MGPHSLGPRALLLAALLVLLSSCVLLMGHRYGGRAPVQHPDNRTEQPVRPLQSYNRRQLRWSYTNTSLDDESQREALLALYNATNGAAWKVANITSTGAFPWGTGGVSYCRWFGVTCCASSPLSLVNCSGLHSVVILSLDGYGLAGSLPAALGNLTQLTVMGLANNPQLVGRLPTTLGSLKILLWMSVEDTGLVACMEASLPPAVAGPCTLPSSLSYTDVRYNPYATNEYKCPATVLASFLSFTTGLAPDLWELLTSPFPPPPTPGAVIAGGNFTRYFNCTCTVGGEWLTVQDGPAGSGAGAVCVAPGSGSSSGRNGLIIGIVIVAVLPWLLMAAAVYICVAHKATLNRLVRRKEAEMARKRSKVPGTPGVALQNGRGVLSLSDVMVTWVVTDVAASTQLWEWKPDVMDRAIDLHNAALRSLMEEFGGHEIRNEGDSFTLSFHDAVDAVTFCLKAQEKLMAVEWPKELSEHPRTNMVSVGDVTSNPDAAGKGPPLIAGLRVRMGINTGVPDDIFLHDLTDHVDYRGLEYDLAGEICDLAEGGQVLMGPRTLQRWNKVNYSALMDPPMADLLRDQQGGSFLQVSNQPPTLMHGPSGRRGSMTGFGGGVPGGMGLSRESQQLQGHYGSTYGIAPGGGPPTSQGFALTTAATMRRNSDSQQQQQQQQQAGQQQQSGAPQVFVRLSDGEEGLDDDATSSAPPSNQPGSNAILRSLRMHRSSSPSRVVRATLTGRMGAHSSDGTPSGGKALGPGSPLAHSARSKLGSPRAMQASSTGNDGTGGGVGGGIGGGSVSGLPVRVRAATVLATTAAVGIKAEDADGRQLGRPVRRVNSTEGLLRMHAARAAEMAAAAAAAAAAARSSQGGRGMSSHADASDDDHGSSHIMSPQLPARLSTARASAGSVCDERPGHGLFRRLAADPDLGVSGASPLAVTPALQRWLSNGWRPPAHSIPRAHTANAGSLAGAAAAATAAAAAAATTAGGGGGTPAAASQSPVGSGTPGRSSNGNGTGTMSLGGRLLWLRMHGGATARGLASMMRRRAAAGGGVLAVGALAPGNPGSPEGPASMPVVSLEDDVAATSGSNSARGLNRISSLPATVTGGTAMAAGTSRLAALQRRVVGSEAVSREGSLRHQNALFLRNPSREGSRDERVDTSPGAVTPARADSEGQQHLATTGPLETDAGSSTTVPPSGGDRRGGPCGGGGRPGAPMQATSPIVGLGGHYGSGDGVRPGGRRTMMGMPGPPRMSLANETGLHPLLLNPMQPGGLAMMPMHPLLGRVPALRHPNAMGPRPGGSIPLAPSPLGISALAQTDAAVGPGSGQEPFVQTGDSITSAGGHITRGLTVLSIANRQLADQALRGSGDGGAGGLGGVPASGVMIGPRGDSGSLLKAPSIGHQGGPHAQLSYQHFTQPGYYDEPDFVGGGGVGGNAGGNGRAGEPRSLFVQMLTRVRALWCELASAFWNMLRRCLQCVRLLTSSDDDPADVDIWEHADSAVLGGAPAGHRIAAVGSKPQETKGVLVDMGYYNFMSVDYNGQMPVGHYVHLMQIVPSSVAPRVLLFPWPLSLPTGWEKISPGFFDAPGSSRLLFPAMRELMGVDLQLMRPLVTVAFSSIEGIKELSAVSVEAARDVLQLHNAAVRETLSTCSGYECKEFNGSFMTTFGMATSAVEWALTLQMALVAMPWPDELLACEHAAVVLHPENDTVLFRGLRCRVGIYAGPIDRVTPHPKTGRADYFGQPVNRAARLMTAAQGGQVVLDQNLLDEVLDEWRRRQEVRRLATIPSVEEGSPVDEGSLAGPSEMRTARSFVSAKSTNKLLSKQHSVVALAAGNLSAAASSTPSITNLPELSLQQLSSRADSSVHPAATPIGHANPPTAAAAAATAASVGAGTDGMPVSPFGSPRGSVLSKMLSNNGLKDYTTDGSVSPRGSAPAGMSPARTSTNTNTCGAGTAIGAGSGASGAPAGTLGGTLVAGTAAPSPLSTSNTASLARSLERLMTDQKVQRSARSEPRIPRISRFGLGGITAVLRGGGGSRAAGTAAGGGGGSSPRSGGGASGSTAGGASSTLLVSLPPLPTTSSHSLNVPSSSQSPWLPDTSTSAGGGGGGGARSGPPPGRSVSFLQRSIGGARTAVNLFGGGSTPRSPPSRSLANGGAGASNGQVASLHSHSLISRTSPAPSVPTSIAGAAVTGGGMPGTPPVLSGSSATGISLAPGLELQVAEWDPATRGAASVRARRQRRASIGAIVENLLVSGRKASTVAASGGGGGAVPQGSNASHHHQQQRHHRPPSSRGGARTPGWSPSSRISPAALAARARLLPGSPSSPASLTGPFPGGGARDAGTSDGGGTGSLSMPSPFGVLQVDLPDSPSNSTALTSPRSPGSSKLPLVQRMASSPLGLPAYAAGSTMGQFPGDSGCPPRRQSLGGGSHSSGSQNTLHMLGGGGSAGGGGGRISGVPLQGQGHAGRLGTFHSQHYRHHSFQHRQAWAGLGIDPRVTWTSLPSQQGGPSPAAGTTAQRGPSGSPAADVYDPRLARRPSPLCQGMDAFVARPQSTGNALYGSAQSGNLDSAFAAAAVAPVERLSAGPRFGRRHSAALMGRSAAVLSSVAEGQSPSFASNLEPYSNPPKCMLTIYPPITAAATQSSLPSCGVSAGVADSWPDAEGAFSAAGAAAAEAAPLANGYPGSAQAETRRMGGIGGGSSGGAGGSGEDVTGPGTQPVGRTDAAASSGSRTGGAMDRRGYASDNDPSDTSNHPPHSMVTAVDVQVPNAHFLACYNSVAGEPPTSTTTGTGNLTLLSPSLLDFQSREQAEHVGSGDCAEQAGVGGRGRSVRSASADSYRERDTGGYETHHGIRDVDAPERVSAPDRLSTGTSNGGSVSDLSPRGMHGLAGDKRSPKGPWTGAATGVRSLAAAGGGAARGTTSGSVRTSLPTSFGSQTSSPRSQYMAELLPRLPMTSERFSLQLVHHTHAPSTSASTTSSRLTRRVFERSSSAVVSGMLTEGDVMPTFAANLISRPSASDRPSNPSGAAAGILSSGGVPRSEMDLAGSDVAQSPAGAGGSRGQGPAPMLSRGYATMHGNPAYGTRRSVAGETTIEEEEQVESMDLLVPMSSTSRSRTAAAAPSPTLALRPPRHGRQLGDSRQPSGPLSDANGSMLPGMPPLLGPLNGMKNATGAGQRMSDGPHSRQGPSSSSTTSPSRTSQQQRQSHQSVRHQAQQPQQAPSQPQQLPLNGMLSTGEIGRALVERRLYSRNSSTGTTYSVPLVADSPSVSDAFTYRRSGTNEHPPVLASGGGGGGGAVGGSGASGGGGGAGAVTSSVRIGSKHTSGSLYGSTTALTQSAGLSSVDAVTLAAVTAAAATTNASGAGGLSSSAAASGTAQFLPGQEVASAAHAHGSAASSLAAAGPNVRLNSGVAGPPPVAFQVSAASRRRASSGAIGVSLRAAAEVAINQLHNQSASTHLPATPTRALRKSTSSRGRRNYGGSSDSRGMASPTASYMDPGLQTLAAMGTAASGGVGLGHTSRGSRGIGARQLRGGGGGGGGVDSSPGGAYGLSPAIEQLAALVSPHGGLDLRASPPQERPAVTPRGPGGGSMPRVSGSDGTTSLFSVLGARRSAPGHSLVPATAAQGYASAATNAGTGGPTGGHLAIPDSLRTPTRSSGNNASSSAVNATAAAAGTSGQPGSPSGGLPAAGLPPGVNALSLYQQPVGYDPSGPGAAPEYISSSGGVTMGILRRSSAGSHVHQPGNNPGYASPSTYNMYQSQQGGQLLGAYHFGAGTSTSSMHGRYGAAEVLGAVAPPPQSLPTVPHLPVMSAPGVHRSHRTSYLLASGGMAGATAPSTPLAGSVGAGTSNAMRLAMNRSSTPPVGGGAAGASTSSVGAGPDGVHLPPVANITASSTVGATRASTGPFAAQSAPGGGGGSSITPPSVTPLHMARLRASNQSLPEDLVASTPHSHSREILRAPDFGTVTGTTLTSLPGLPTRGSRWRSPRGGPVFPGDDGAAAGSSATGGGGGGTGGGGSSGVGGGASAAMGMGASPDKPMTSGAPGALDAGGGGAAGGGGGGGKGEKDKENRPAVMAECYKITQQPAGGVGAGGNEVAQSITMIKYTNLKQELERNEDNEGDDVPVPTNMLLVPTVAVEVAIWSLGSFRLKGVTEPIKIVQVLPVELEGRLAFLNKAGLNRGKARCIERRVACLDVITLQLPDVSRLSCVSLGAGGTPGGGSMDGGGGGIADGYNTGLGDGNAGGDACWPPSLDAPMESGGMGGVMMVGGMMGRGGMGVPIGPGQMMAVEARWGGMRSIPLREIESSEAGLPPISEVVTPVSSPLLRKRDQTGTHGGSGASMTSQGRGGGNYGVGPGSAGTLARRRSMLAPPPVTIPDGPMSTGDYDRVDSVGGQSVSLQPGTQAAGEAPDGGEPLPTPAPMPGGETLDGQHQFHHQRFYDQEPQQGLQGQGPDGEQGGGLLRQGGEDGPSPGRRRPSPTGWPVSLPRRGASAHGADPVASLPLPAALANGRSSADQPSGMAGGGPPLPMEVYGMRRRDSSATGGPGSIADAGSTGLLPMSLSYLAPRARDTHSTYAAMISAGMDVRSPGGSPVSTLNLPSHLGPLGPWGGGGGYLAQLPPLNEGEALSNMPYADIAGSGGGGGNMPPPLLLPERNSTNTYTHAHSGLVIDRSSSGFYHALSSGYTPAHAFTDRSSYGSSMAPQHFTANDRTSSGLDWPSSSHRCPSPLPASGPLGHRYSNATGTSGGSSAQHPLAQLPERMSPSGLTTFDSNLSVGGISSSVSAFSGAGVAGGSGAVRNHGVPYASSPNRLFAPHNTTSSSGAAGSGHDHLPSRLSGTRPFAVEVAVEGPEAGIHSLAEPVRLQYDDEGGGAEPGGIAGSHGGAATRMVPSVADCMGGTGGGGDNSSVLEASPEEAGPVPQHQHQSPPLPRAPTFNQMYPQPQPRPQSRPQLLHMVQQRMLAGAIEARSLSRQEGHPEAPVFTAGTATWVMQDVGTAGGGGRISLTAGADSPITSQPASAHLPSPRSLATSGHGSSSGGGSGLATAGAAAAAGASGAVAATACTGPFPADSNMYDITVSVRSSLAGSAAGGRMSTAGSPPLTAVESLRAFGLSHLLPNSGPLEPVSASDLFRPFADARASIGGGEGVGGGVIGGGGGVGLAGGGGVGLRGGREGGAGEASVSQHWQRPESRCNSGSGRHGPAAGPELQ